MRSVSAFCVVTLLLAAGCPSLKSFYRGRDDVAATVDIPYRDDDLHKHRLDLYRPRDVKGWPVVIFIHGGYWRGGDKTYWQAITGLYGNVGIALGELGVGAAIANYRLFPDATLDDMLDDVAGAILWTRAHVEETGGDPDRIFLAGHSAGGHLVTLLGSHHELLEKRGVDPSWVKGVVSVSGIYDIPSTMQVVDPELHDEVFVPLFGEDVEEERAASPLVHMGEGMTPTLFIVGDSDYRSCMRDFDAVKKQLAPLEGSRAWFHRIEHQAHEDMVLEMATADDDVAPRIAAFVHVIDEALGGAP